MSSAISGVITTRIRVWPGPRLANVCTAGQDLLSSGVVASCLEQLLQQPDLLLLAADKLSQ